VHLFLGILKHTLLSKNNSISGSQQQPDCCESAIVAPSTHPLYLSWSIRPLFVSSRPLIFARVSTSQPIKSSRIDCSIKSANFWKKIQSGVTSSFHSIPIMYSTNLATVAAAGGISNSNNNNNNSKNTTANMLNLEDIFGDVLFTPDGDTVCTFLVGALQSGLVRSDLFLLLLLLSFCVFCFF
jgi:hypothetical protein